MSLVEEEQIIDTFAFTKHTGQRVTDNILHCSPSEILTMLRLYKEHEHICQKIVARSLDGLKHHQIDIRLFNFPQLTTFVGYVAQYQSKDLKVFYNYILTAFESGYFNVGPKNF